MSLTPSMVPYLSQAPPAPEQPTLPLQGIPAPVTPPTPNTVPTPNTPTASPLATSVAQNSLVANKQNPGSWADNLVAGVTSALAGFSLPKPAPVGAGVMSGIGQAAQMMQARKQKALENQRAERKLSIEEQENARQQAK